MVNTDNQRPIGIGYDANGKAKSFIELTNVSVSSVSAVVSVTAPTVSSTSAHFDVISATTYQNAPGAGTVSDGDLLLYAPLSGAGFTGSVSAPLFSATNFSATTISATTYINAPGSELTLGLYVPVSAPALHLHSYVPTSGVVSENTFYLANVNVNTVSSTHYVNIPDPLGLYVAVSAPAQHLHNYVPVSAPALHLHSYVPTSGVTSENTFYLANVNANTVSSTNYEGLDPTLVALSGITTVVGSVPFFTAEDVASTFTTTTHGRNFTNTNTLLRDILDASSLEASPLDGDILFWHAGKDSWYASALDNPGLDFSPIASSLDHGALSGLGDNDHPQYPLESVVNSSYAPLSGASFIGNVNGTTATFTGNLTTNLKSKLLYTNATNLMLGASYSNFPEANTFIMTTEAASISGVDTSAAPTVFVDGTFPHAKLIDMGASTVLMNSTAATAAVSATPVTVIRDLIEAPYYLSAQISPASAAFRTISNSTSAYEDFITVNIPANTLQTNGKVVVDVLAYLFNNTGRTITLSAKLFLGATQIWSMSNGSTFVDDTQPYPWRMSFEITGAGDATSQWISGHGAVAGANGLGGWLFGRQIVWVFASEASEDATTDLDFTLQFRVDNEDTNTYNSLFEQRVTVHPSPGVTRFS